MVTQTLLDQSSFKVNNSWFKCQPFTRVRNRIFYPIAFYDNEIYVSRRYPLLRLLLRPFSWLYHFVMIILYPLAYNVQKTYEIRRKYQLTGLTIMLDVERSKR